MPQRNWNNIPDLLRTMPMKVTTKDGKISNFNGTLTDTLTDIVLRRSGILFQFL